MVGSWDDDIGTTRQPWRDESDRLMQMAPLPRTKIVATIGPATAAPDQIDALLDAGVSVVRINCAHSADDQTGRTVRVLRARAELQARPVAILADLSGPKLRIGRFRNGAVALRSGASFVLTTTEILGTEERVTVAHPTLPREVRPGDAIYLNDGMLALRVTGTSDSEVYTRIEVGGDLSDGKGLSVPGVDHHSPSLTAKDRRDLDLLTADGVDYVGMSFVRSEGDLVQLREALAARNLAVPIVAKIEKAQAIPRLDAIVRAADAVMVARGDLGVDCPIEDVPLLQKRIIRLCNRLGTPVITATQMLESMTTNPRPTRAEASDVANAVFDGSDAVMLSAETAAGRFPVEAVRVMRRILAAAEACAPPDGVRVLEAGEATDHVGQAIGRSACLAARAVGAQAIVCLTRSGATARQVAQWRPSQPILAVTPELETWRRLSLVWGVEPILVADFGPDFDPACTRILRLLREREQLDTQRTVVITAGLPFLTHRGSNTVRIEMPV